MCSNTPPPVVTAPPNCPFVAFSNRAVPKYILNRKNDGGQADNGHRREIGLIKCPDGKIRRKLKLGQFGESA